MPTKNHQDEAGAWDRRRLLGVLAGVLAAVVLLVAGLVYAVVWALGSATETTATGTAPGSGPVHVDGVTAQQRRDAIASAPMTAVDASAATTGNPAAVPGRSITVPAATTVGPAEVPTGFAHTPHGALGQLAAIDTTVLSGMDLAHTGTVHRAWALPGAPPTGQWVMTGNVQAFLAGTGIRAVDAVTVVTATPVAGQVKGTHGEDWVLACVLLDVRATITATARIGYGHCERMQWTYSDSDVAGGEVGGRWMIAPGPQPAPAPSTWPGSQAAVDAGWAAWVQQDQP